MKLFQQVVFVYNLIKTYSYITMKFCHKIAMKICSIILLLVNSLYEKS